MLLALTIPCAARCESVDGLRVAAVQLELSERDTASLDAFRLHMQAAAREAAVSGAELIVFPEYTGALAGLIPYSWALGGTRSAAEALGLIHARDPSIRSVHDVFVDTSDYALRTMRDVFGGIATACGAYVVAGTYFATEPGPAGGTMLRNRALVFAPDGSLTYVQDKVYLTEFEEEIGMEPGLVEAARPFAVYGRLVALTICRDTFFGVWEQAFAGVDLWIDIKGNGEPFSEEVAERFARALPARLRSSGVPEGITVCLNGRLLDFVWEGPSSYVRRSADGSVTIVSRARSVRGEEILAVRTGGR